MSDDVVEAEEYQVESVNGQGEPSAVNVQVETAKKYPRSVDKCMKEAKTLATKNQEVAGSCFYSLPRGSGTIQGPSIRLAEIMLYSWQNLRADSKVIDESHKEVTAEATCIDLEKNTAVRKQVTRSIIDSGGDRYSPDMIRNTKNAAMSIALRNAVFSVIPEAFVSEIFEAAQKASIGDGTTMETKRKAAIDYFENLGVDRRQLFNKLDVNGPEDISEEELIQLRGLKTALEENQVSVEEVFGDQTGGGSSVINEWVDDEEESGDFDDSSETGSDETGGSTEKPHPNQEENGNDEGPDPSNASDDGENGESVDSENGGSVDDGQDRPDWADEWLDRTIADIQDAYEADEIPLQGIIDRERQLPEDEQRKTLLDWASKEMDKREAPDPDDAEPLA